ncbi:myoneurin [Drosophila grimshawi]|uniref:GH22317 n=1 Tax=Drosophila grimshawi TaxID=7222 RepID=B4JYX2_DROGR|nr:myoneurin [Drosophila grimshawi]EDV98587.1 GH22317 [Drosophila grimshawi]
MSAVHLCRTCGEKIYHLNATNLFEKESREIVENIATLTGIRFDEGEDMPKHICPCCLLDLNYSIAFRERCINVQRLLRDGQHEEATTLDPLNCSPQRKVTTLKIKSSKQPQSKIVRTHMEPYHISSSHTSRRLTVAQSTVQHVRCSFKGVTAPGATYEASIAYPEADRHAKATSPSPTKATSLTWSNETKKAMHSVSVNAPSAAHHTRSSAKTIINPAPSTFEPHKSYTEAKCCGSANNSSSAKSRSKGSGLEFTQSSTVDYESEFLRTQSAVIKKFVCDQCGKCFADHSNLKVHILRHGIKNFECPDCDAKYYTNHLLNLHIRVRHKGEKPYACKYCGQRFFTSTARCRHERVKHTKKYSFVCKYCGKTYLTKSCLNKHEFLHTGQRPFLCEICNVAFPRKTNLKLHYRSKQHQRRAADMLGTKCDIIEEIPDEATEMDIADLIVEEFDE